MAKAKGKEKPAASDVPVETEDSIDDATAEETLSEPVEMEVAAEISDTVGNEPDEVENAEESEKELEEADNEEEAEEDGPVDAEMTADAKEAEKVEEESKNEEDEGKEKVESASNKKTKRNKRKKAAPNNATATNNSSKTGTSAAEKGKKVDGMGLIFMCNSKTKKDCYRYNVLGLPENKKELVEKVYKGMRLFLYDIDLKLMYGIYKAASPGGYNLEPKAFKSAFPSQVRFTVLNDCKPLPEEKFKAAIKSNYSGRNRFNCQLSPEQVKNLCKLFLGENKTPLGQKRGGVGKEPISARRDLTRRPPRGVRNNDRYPRAPVLYPVDTYASPPARPLFRAPPPLTYAYERPADDYYYRREPPPPMEFRDPRIGEPRQYEPVGYDRDPYNIYREPAPFREPLYPASLSSAYAPPPPQFRY